MKKLTIILFFLFTIALFAQNVPVNKRSRIYTADFKSVLKAVVEYCNYKEFPINFVDKEFGILNTDYKFTDNGYRTKINFVIRSFETGKVKLIATITAEEKGYTGWQKAQITGRGMIDNYNKIFSYISDLLN